MTDKLDKTIGQITEERLYAVPLLLFVYAKGEADATLEAEKLTSLAYLAKFTTVLPPVDIHGQNKNITAITIRDHLGKLAAGKKDTDDRMAQAEDREVLDTTLAALYALRVKYFGAPAIGTRHVLRKNESDGGQEPGQDTGEAGGNEEPEPPGE